MRNRPSTPRTLVLAIGLLGSAGANAVDFNNLQTLTQAEFRGLSEDLGSALSFKPLIPSEPTGITGFDIGIALTGTKLQNVAAFQKATSSGTVQSTLTVPTVRAHKGLPLDFDIGVAFGSVPSSNMRVMSGELRWALLAGSTVSPALALRASFSSLSGVDQLSFNTTGLDISISKGFAMLTPYAGVGTVRVTSDAQGSATQTTESFNQNKVFAGLNLSLGLVNFAFEGDKTGETTSYGMKFGLRF